MEGKGKGISPEDVEIDSVFVEYGLAKCQGCPDAISYLVKMIDRIKRQSRAEGKLDGAREFAEKLKNELEDASSAEIECKEDRAYVDGIYKAIEILEKLRQAGK